MQLGIDIGGTTTKIGIVNDQGQITHQTVITTKGHANSSAFVEALYKAVYLEFPPDRVGQLTRIGIGAPNGNYYSGNIEFAPNLEWKGMIPMARMVQEKFNLPTKLSNDANAAAMGEMIYGAAKGMKNFIMITLGTGVGSGFVANGQLIYGHDGFAGELGHVIAVRDGRLCGCGRNGCLEVYTSATGIVKNAEEILSLTEEDSYLRYLEGITSKDIFDGAVHKDKICLEIFEFTGKILGQTLADAVAITSPEAIILFGGLAQAGSFIFEPTQRYMEQNLLSIYKNKVKIIPSLLKESDVAILGAASIV